jgi:hypothetical protein
MDERRGPAGSQRLSAAAGGAGLYGTYWVKHLNEITVIDGVFDGFWMKSAYRIPDTPNNSVEPGTAPKATIPINRFTVRSFITNLADGAKVKPGITALKGIAFDGGKGIKEVAVSTDGGKTWMPAKLGKDLGRYSFREWTLPVKLTAGAYALKVRATNNAGDTSRWIPCGIRPAICAMSSRPSTSPRREANDHDASFSFRFRCRHGCRPLFGNRRAGRLHAAGGNRGLQTGAKSRRGEEQLHRLSFRRLRQYPAARAEIQKGLLAGRSDQDDQGIWRADRRRRRAQDRGLSHRDLLKFDRGLASG